jgi:hypothetical protein
MEKAASVLIETFVSVTIAIEVNRFPCQYRLNSQKRTVQQWKAGIKFNFGWCVLIWIQFKFGDVHGCPSISRVQHILRVNQSNWDGSPPRAARAAFGYSDHQLYLKFYCSILNRKYSYNRVTLV